MKIGDVYQCNLRPELQVMVGVIKQCDPDGHYITGTELWCLPDGSLISVQADSIRKKDSITILADTSTKAWGGGSQGEPEVPSLLTPRKS